MNWTTFSRWLLKGYLAIALFSLVSIANTTLMFVQSERSGNNTFARSRIFFKVPDKGTPAPSNDPADTDSSR